MNQETLRHEITRKGIVHLPHGVDSVTIRCDLEYLATEAGELTMDIYYPADSDMGEPVPAMVFVSGYPDPGMERMLGCKLKDMESYVSWGKLTAFSGLAAITYSTSTDPAAEIDAVLQFVRRNGAALGIDENRMGLWACSGNVPNALSVLMHEENESLKCAVLCYGFMLDREGTTNVASAASKWGFVNPCVGKSAANLPKDLPLFIVRAGQDETPHLNETMDQFLSQALIYNLPVTFVNHPTAPHAFDLMHDSETTREIIRQITAFMRFHLLESGK